METTALAEPQSPKASLNIPLYIPTREHPRPAAKAWIAKAAQTHSIAPLQDEPWLPLTAIEGVLVIGHHDLTVPSTDFPEGVTIRVRLRTKDYISIQARSIETLAAMYNDHKRLKAAWGELESEHQAKINEGTEEWREPLHIRILRFLFTLGVTPREVGTRTPVQYLGHYKEAAWIFHCIEKGLPILPTEDLNPNTIPAGRLPDAVISKYKSVCYYAEDTSLHIMLPAGTGASTFKTEVRARLSGTEQLEIAFCDPVTLNRFIESSTIDKTESRETVRKPSDVEDSGGVMNCDPSLKNQPLQLIEDTRELLAWIIVQGINSGATDIHLDPLDNITAAIRYRMNSVLRQFGSIKIDTLKKLLSVIKQQCNINQLLTTTPQDGKFRIRSGDKTADIRVSTIPLQKAEQYECAALRILGRVQIPDLNALQLSDYKREQLKWVFDRDYGLFTVTGPTGSGKTTTLNCCLREIAGESINVLSVEDPVELPIPWVKQVQVTGDLNFSTALRAFLRHDPDAIMVGEVRDNDTADITLKASQTGHLVFATLHTNNALMSCVRLKEMGVDRNVLGSSLLGVQAQRLVRSLCPACREQIDTPKDQIAYARRFCERVKRSLGPDPECPEAEMLIESIQKWISVGKTYRPTGCSSCRSTGFDRSKAIMEIYLIGNDQVAIDMIIEGLPVSALQKHFAQQGLVDLAGESMLMMATHQTTFDEIKKHLPLIAERRKGDSDVTAKLTTIVTPAVPTLTLTDPRDIPLQQAKTAA